MGFKTSVADGQPLIGTVLSLASPEVAEMTALLGFDWAWIDMEHAPTALDGVQKMLQAVGGRIPTLVRVPWNDPVWMKRVLDLGCDGIIVPQIRSADEATAAVQACLYPPAGSRSVGIGRAQHYGMDLQHHIATANSRVCIVLQIEHRDAVDRIEQILSVKGFDAILIGPYDLSGSHGVLGQVSHDSVTASLLRIREAAKSHAKAVGIFAADAEAAKAHMAAGMTLIALGTDAMFYWKSARQALHELRPDHIKPR